VSHDSGNKPQVAGWLPMYFALSPAVQWKAPYWALCVFSLLQGQQMLTTDVAVVRGLGRLFALYYHASPSYQIHKHIGCLYF
jgi:hypothetical protein